MKRPALRMSAPFIYLSFHMEHPDTIKLLQDTGSPVTVETIPDQQHPWTTVKYPALENPFVVKTLQMMGYRGLFSGCVKHLDERQAPVYHETPALGRIPLVAGLAIIEPTLRWIDYDSLRKLVTLVDKEQGYLVGVQCSTQDELIERFDWPKPMVDDAFQYVRRCAILDYVRMVPTPGELFASLLASTHMWQDPGRWAFNLTQIIDNALRHGVDHRSPL